MEGIFYNGCENNINNIDTFYKIAMFSKWFEKKTKKYEHQRDGKFCDIEIKIKHKAFSKTFNECYKKYMRHYETRNDCFCDCMLLVWEGMNLFEIKDGSNWKNIFEGKDKKNFGKLMTYINRHIKFELERQLYPKISTSKTIKTKEGKKQFLVYYNVDLESLNRLSSYKGEKEKVELINITKNSFWDKKEEYCYSMFTQWAIDNMKEVLSEKQRKFLNELEKANYSKLDNDYYDNEISANKNLTRQRVRCIYERIAKAYSKDKKVYDGGFVVQSLNAQLKQFKKITNVVYRDDIEPNDLNKEVSKQILRSMNNSHFSNLLYDKLESGELKTIIKIYLGSMITDNEDMKLFIDELTIPSNIVYHVVDIVEQKIVTLENRLEYEKTLLQYEYLEKKKKTDLVQFDHNVENKCVHLKLNSYGVAVPKYEN